MAPELEPPYYFIWQAIKAGKVIPFLGAGASLGGRPSNEPWHPMAEFPPSGRELATRLAQISRYPPSWLLDHFNRFKAELDNVRTQLNELDTGPNNLGGLLDELESGIRSLDDLAKVASYLETRIGRDELKNQLREVFETEYQPGPIHKFLAKLDTPLLIVTTNYDDLIEAAFKNVHKPYHLVVHAADRSEHGGAVLWWKPGSIEPTPCSPNAMDLELSDTTIIYKMHGSINREQEGRDNYVITEDDYIDFLSRMISRTAIPAQIMLEFRKKDFLFLGYGLQDWNFRVVLKNLGTNSIHRQDGISEQESPSNPTVDQTALPPSIWAIQYRPSALEKWLWDKRGVDLFDVDIVEFVGELAEERRSDESN
jgi:hypothetical protein